MSPPKVGGWLELKVFVHTRRDLVSRRLNFSSILLFVIHCGFHLPIKGGGGRGGSPFTLMVLVNLRKLVWFRHAAIADSPPSFTK